MRCRFGMGSRVRMTLEALENYGYEHSGRVFVVEHVATRYMPTKRFFRLGMPSGCHLGFDEASGSVLYDLEGFESSLYDWELESEE
jgi:hypothetical protein